MYKEEKGLLYRFYVYQRERFPFAVLIFTTLSVVLSSSAVVLPAQERILDHITGIIIGTIVGLLFMFHIRVFDDFKDKKFDTEFHKDRPVQRGIISLKELRIFNLIGLLIQIILNLFYSIFASLWWLIALGYTLIARAEFFMKNWIRKKFLFYNALNLLQIFFLQIYIYALIEPSFSWKNPLLFVHFIFVLSNAGILDVARKLKSKEEESLGKDTYSAQLGIKGASMLYSSMYIGTYILFSFMLFKLIDTYTLFYVSIIPLSLIIISTMIYLKKRNKFSTKLVEGVGVIFYLSMHLLLVFTNL